jgi:hypothetical protein
MAQHSDVKTHPSAEKRSGIEKHVRWHALPSFVRCTKGNGEGGKAVRSHRGGRIAE